MHKTCNKEFNGYNICSLSKAGKMSMIARSNHNKPRKTGMVLNHSASCDKIVKCRAIEYGRLYLNPSLSCVLEEISFKVKNWVCRITRRFYEEKSMGLVYNNTWNEE